MSEEPSAFDFLLLETLIVLKRVRDLGDHELALVAEFVKTYDEAGLRSFRNRLGHQDSTSDFVEEVSEAEFAALVEASQELGRRLAQMGNSSQHSIVDVGQSHGRSLHRPPGMHLNRWAETICSKKTYECVFQPILADMQHEYFVALKDGRQRKAQWVIWRGRLSFVMAALAQLPVSATQLIVKLWKAAS